MQDKVFRCPHCGKEIQVSEALTHEIEERVAESLKLDHAKDLEEVSKKAERVAFEKLQKDFEIQIERLNKEKEEEAGRNNKPIKTK